MQMYVPAIILWLFLNILNFFMAYESWNTLLILFLLSIVSLIILVDNPLFCLGSPFSGCFLLSDGLFMFYKIISLIAFIKSLLTLTRFQTNYSILLAINSFFSPLLAFLNLLFLRLEFLPNSSMYFIFILLAASGIAQAIIEERKTKNEDYMAESERQCEVDSCYLRY